MQMHQTVQRSTSRLANEVARAIRDRFAQFYDEFRMITRRAEHRFTTRDWHGLREDARQRLEVHDSVIDQLLLDVRSTLGDRLHSRSIWTGCKAVYSGLIEHRDDWEIAETFFNSVTRRIFTTVGVDTEVEFVHTDYDCPPTSSPGEVYKNYEGETPYHLIANILEDHPGLQVTQSMIRENILAVASRIAEELDSLGYPGEIDSAHVAKAVFYRGECAYLMGRVFAGSRALPLALCIRNNEMGVHVDAVLLREQDLSLLFSYTRSYFMVEVARPHDLVDFINSMIPNKRIAEIYISLGYNKHGKTELYRNALQHLATSEDKYQLAEGQRGMVMTVFTMPSFPVVIKIIKDRFDFPKECTRQQVIDRYRQVFKHDRAGRLMDAQEYKYLVLDRRHFNEQLITELARVATKTVSIEGDQVVIKHCYAERRVRPLDVFLREAPEDAARTAVIDYGRAIKELALTNLFPGDLLLKNFGVTRNNRVVFYDYDEICLLSECNFRKLPDTGHYDDEIAAEPWFGVGRHDIFPEEFIHYLGLSPPLREIFVQHHSDLLEVAFWRNLKERLAVGELFHVPPYANSKRLDPKVPFGAVPVLDHARACPEIV